MRFSGLEVGMRVEKLGPRVEGILGGLWDLETTCSCSSALLIIL